MCSLGENCKHSHDLVAYMKERLADPLDFSDEPCPVFKQLGQCPFGVRCHFFRAHTDEGGKQIVAEAATLPVQVNVLSRDVLIGMLDRRYIVIPRRNATSDELSFISSALRKKVHKFPRAEEQYRELQKYLESTADAASRGEKSEVAVVDASVEQPASIDVNGAIEESQPVASVEEEQLAVGAVIIDTKSEAKIKKVVSYMRHVTKMHFIMIPLHSVHRLARQVVLGPADDGRQSSIPTPLQEAWCGRDLR